MVCLCLARPAFEWPGAVNPTHRLGMGREGWPRSVYPGDVIADTGENGRSEANAPGVAGGSFQRHPVTPFR